MQLLAGSLYNQYRLDEAEAVYRRSLELSIRILGSEHKDVRGIQSSLAGTLARQGRHTEAEAIYRETLAAQLQTVGPTDHGTITTQRFLAGCLSWQGKYLDAETLLREALVAAQQRYGPEHGDTSIRLMSALTGVLVAQRNDTEAEQVARQVLEFQHRQLPRPDVGELQDSYKALIKVLQRRGANDEALAVEQELIEYLLAAARAPDANAGTLYFAAWSLLKPANETHRDAPQALKLALQANDGSAHQNPLHLRMLARAYMGTGDSAAAMQVWAQAIALSSNDQSRAMTLDYAAAELLTVTPEALRNPAEALKFALRANELSDYKNPGYVDTLALAHFRTGDNPKAIDFQKQALDLLPQDSPQRPDYEARLAEFEAALEKAGGVDGTP